MGAREAVISGGLLVLVGALFAGDYWFWAFILLLLTGRWVIVCTAMVTAAVAAMNLLYAAGGGSGLLIDLPLYFANLHGAPGHPQFWWLYFMFLSTLIPTLLHFAIAGAAGSQWLAAHWLGRGPWRERMADSMATHGVHRLYAQLYLTIVPMLGLVVPLALLWFIHWGLTTHGGVAGVWFLSQAEGIASTVMGDL